MQGNDSIESILEFENRSPQYQDDLEDFLQGIDPGHSIYSNAGNVSETTFAEFQGWGQSSPDAAPWNPVVFNTTPHGQTIMHNGALLSSASASQWQPSYSTSLSAATSSQTGYSFLGPPAPSTGDGVSIYSDYISPENPLVSTAWPPVMPAPHSYAETATLPSSIIETSIGEYTPGCVCCGTRWHDRTLFDRHRINKDHFANGRQYLCKCGYRTARKDNHRRHLKGDCDRKFDPVLSFSCICGEQYRDIDKHFDHFEQCGKRRPGRRPNRVRSSS